MANDVGVGHAQDQGQEEKGQGQERGQGHVQDHADHDQEKGPDQGQRGQGLVKDPGLVHGEDQDHGKNLLFWYCIWKILLYFCCSMFASGILSVVASSYVHMLHFLFVQIFWHRILLNWIEIIMPRQQSWRGMQEWLCLFICFCIHLFVHHPFEVSAHICTDLKHFELDRSHQAW